MIDLPAFNVGWRVHRLSVGGDTKSLNSSSFTSFYDRRRLLKCSDVSHRPPLQWLAFSSVVLYLLAVQPVMAPE